MREIRLYGSEGGGTELNRSSLPLSKSVALEGIPLDHGHAEDQQDHHPGP
jgi:hypothetical protein